MLGVWLFCSYFIIICFHLSISNGLIQEFRLGKGEGLCWRVGLFSCRCVMCTHAAIYKQVVQKRLGHIRGGGGGGNSTQGVEIPDCPLCPLSSLPFCIKH